jgi:hypothetical protein
MKVKYIHHRASDCCSFQGRFHTKSIYQVSMFNFFSSTEASVFGYHLDRGQDFAFPGVLTTVSSFTLPFLIFNPTLWYSKLQLT